ncbi:unnamed protein product [Soboliphyme baturini]|uniref:Secreted protein n=1 Tax=Soboliphyme baturini TaxID=241478 RepID=A0A183JAI7_9BILA|nr:unnamed protein product [Soboliphyme baturini]
MCCCLNAAMASAGTLLFLDAFVVCSCAIFACGLVVTPGQPTSAPIGCHLRRIRFLVEKFDTNGRKCTGSISTVGCYGSCDSREVRNVEKLLHMIRFIFAAVVQLLDFLELLSDNLKRIGT